MTKAPKKAKPKGRPATEFDPAIANAICERLISGESLRHICGSPRKPGIPDISVVFRWITTNEDFAAQYAHAREVQGEVYADRAVHEALTAGDASIGRLRMDALKWAASKLAPKKYGDKIEHEHKGGVTLMMGDLDDKI